MSDGWDGMDGMGLSYTAVTPRASLMSDANKYQKIIPGHSFNDDAPSMMVTMTTALPCQLQ